MSLPGIKTSSIASFLHKKVTSQERWKKKALGRNVVILSFGKEVRGEQSVGKKKKAERNWGGRRKDVHNVKIVGNPGDV